MDYDFRANANILRDACVKQPSTGDMTEDAENSQLTPTTSGSDVESRMAALEQRFDQLEAKLLSHLGVKSDGTAEHSIEDQARRLATLEERHENLLRHTPEAREEPGPGLIETIILSLIAVAISVSVLNYIFR